MTDPWLRVWLQGGPADDWSYYVLFEPPPVIHVIAIPGRTGEWLHLPTGDESFWPDAVAYERAASVEQFNGERIYYPVESA